MQIVRPIDVEDALRVDVGEIFPGVECFAPPAPDELQPESACFMALGGVAQTVVSNEYSVRVDVWAATDARAMALANEIAGACASLPWRTFQSGRHYLTAEINATPYGNPDPLRPLVPRASFRLEVGIRGEQSI